MKRFFSFFKPNQQSNRLPAIATEALDKNYLYGLNTLRFLAAFFIIAMHIQNNQKVVGIPQLPEFAFLYKGAVSFFFTLSGFLITYIRIGEYEKTGTINIKRFLSNRFARLAPLYYTIVAAGLVFYWLVVPNLGMESYTDYNLGLAAVLYLLFLPNLINSLYHVGGALNVSWSIGVQEQFYWILLPFMKFKMKYFPAFLITVIVLSVFVSIGNAYGIFGLSKEWSAFVNTLRFHYMAIGALLGYLLFYRRDQLLGLWIFSKKWLQLTIFAFLVAWYGFKTDSVFIKNTITLPLSLLYGWIIINVGTNPKNIIKLDNKVFDWIGQRTFGIYLMHMFVVYIVSFFYLKTGLFANHFLLYIFSFYVMVFAITIGLAQLSFKYFEQPIMKRHQAAQKRKKLADAQKNQSQQLATI
ncbi:acyltransferase family protein [Acidiluteibacter ferrifornacis]|uniref:Acyltransferase family protein n=1 Tax=Acidiluteibacter ferrifornacis TaxID=2692424 RepID=A0A6N9NNA2_9FLAO|nr:acyltransferase [Acidiluteibacter ferrifornacis]NBG67374.1 acyltransferase family protein [Acidiluteibacter ferrifornacis]